MSKTEENIQNVKNHILSLEDDGNEIQEKISSIQTETESTARSRVTEFTRATCKKG